MATADALPSPSEILARESRLRRPAAYAALASSLLILLAVVLGSQAMQPELPKVQTTDIFQTLELTRTGQGFPTSASEAYNQQTLDRTGTVVLIAALRSIGLLLLLPAAVLLLTAVRDRGGAVRRWLPPVYLAGFVVAAIASFILNGILQPEYLRAARDAGFQPGDLRDAYEGSGIVQGAIVNFVATMFIAVGLTISALQAARLGLLPKILGFMGGLVAVLFVFPLDPNDLIRTMWFVALAFILRGQFDLAAPAWKKGEAVIAGPRQPAEQPTKKKAPASKGGKRS